LPVSPRGGRTESNPSLIRVRCVRDTVVQLIEIVPPATFLRRHTGACGQQSSADVHSSYKHEAPVSVGTATGDVVGTCTTGAIVGEVRTGAFVGTVTGDVVGSGGIGAIVGEVRTGAFVGTVTVGVVGSGGIGGIVGGMTTGALVGATGAGGGVGLGPTV
jgi:hypothetical protein